MVIVYTEGFSDKTIDRRVEKLHAGVYDDKSIDELTEFGIPASEILKRLRRPEPLKFDKPQFDYQPIKSTGDLGPL